MELKTLLTSAFIVTILGASAQSNEGFAISGDDNNAYAWMNIKKVDLATGKVVKDIFSKNETAYTLTNALTKVSVDQSVAKTGNIYTKEYPTGTFVAGAAYDRRSGKLFYAPMRSNELRWVDLDGNSGSMAFYTLPSEMLKTSENYADESNNITRMVIGADAVGYGITNDGNHLYRFTTGKVPAITDLGPLVDATANTISVHNRCSSWGGDMVADAYGKLYIITANHNVFIADTKTRITEFKGAISGLPANFTTNGAAVDADGNVVLSSATGFVGLYKLNINDLKATFIEGSVSNLSISDLANGNVLFEKEANALATAKVNAPVIASTDIYPNPVTSANFKVQMNGYKAGLYTIMLSDVNGRAVYSKKVSLTASGYHTEAVSLSKKPSSGMYMVKVINEDGIIVLSDKIMVQ